MKTPDIARLPDFFRNHADILAVYLFGSRASVNNIHVESDLDLAIVPRTSSLHKSNLDILTDLARSGFDNVDLVFLDTNDIDRDFN